MKKQVMIEPADLPNVCERLTAAASKVLGDPISPEEERAFTAIWRSLRDMQERMFSYLPEGERRDADALCATYMTLGLAIGGDRDSLVAAIQESGARFKDIADKGGDQ